MEPNLPSSQWYNEWTNQLSNWIKFYPNQVLDEKMWRGWTEIKIGGSPHWRQIDRNIW